MLVIAEPLTVSVLAVELPLRFMEMPLDVMSRMVPMSPEASRSVRCVPLPAKSGCRRATLADQSRVRRS